MKIRITIEHDLNCPQGEDCPCGADRAQRQNIPAFMEGFVSSALGYLDLATFFLENDERVKTAVVEFRSRLRPSHPKDGETS